MASPGDHYSGSEVIPPPPSSGPSQALVTAQPPTLPAIGSSPAGGAGPEILHGGLDQRWFFHCLRRRWLMALLMGMLLASLTAGVLWWLFPESSRTTAYLQVKAKGAKDILTDKREPMSPKEIEMFAASQAALLKSQKVLEHALTPQRIVETEAVKQNSHDAVQWLIDELNVSYPNDGEILEVRYDGDEDPGEMRIIIDQIINSFMETVIQEEIDREMGIHENLVIMHNEIEERLAEKRRDYNRRIESFAGEGSSTAEIEMAMLSGSIREKERRISMAQAELVDLDVNMNVAIQAAQDPAAVDQAIDLAMQADPIIADYQSRVFQYEQQMLELQSMSKNPNSPELRKLAGMRQRAVSMLEQYRREAAAKMKQEYNNKPNAELKGLRLAYNMQRNALLREINSLTAAAEEQRKRLIQKGARDPELEMLKMEIEQDEEVEHILELKTRSHKLTKDNEERQVSIVQRAYTSENINWIERVAIAGIGGLAALAATCYCVALIDFRRRRLNEPVDVDEGLGIRVLGVLPAITNRRALAGTSLGAAQASEGIDNVRATLMHDSTSKQRQVVLVTSSASMDGCSTVATQLAVSLAKAGRRTLLIDADLRSPSLHGLFGMPLEDGFSEVLRSEIDVEEAIRATQQEGLYLLTAGLPDVDAIHALATDLPQPIFETLRAQFDFVIIDSPPILGLADSLSLGQYADGAILTVLRDHTELSKVNRASDLMRRMGIPLLGAVVNGMPMKADRRVTRILKAQAAKQRQIPAAAATADKPTKEKPQSETRKELDELPNNLDDIDIDEL